MAALAAGAMKAAPVVIGALTGNKRKGTGGGGVAAQVGSAVAGAAVSAAAEKSISKKAAAVAQANMPKPAAPLPDEEEVKRTTRRNAALRFGALGSGRASTVLSNDSGKLGA
jgi:hypothetical protein